jgi:N,N'-diacetyllegionaminate synthase
MSDCLVIAEAGVNHNGSLDLARQLVEAAHAAGADVVKFQTFRSEALVTPAAPKAQYQTHNTGEGGSQLAMLKALELKPADFRDLAAHCASLGIEFMSTPFDIDSAHDLAALGMKRIKVSSGDLTNMPFLQELARIGRPIILSSGMATLGEIEAAVEVLEQAGVGIGQISLLHCTTEYPAPMSEVNLRAMQTIAMAFPGATTGYSDHTQGIEISIAAVALGARIIEKHLTLDKTMAGPDHKASLEPHEFAAMVSAIRNVGQALGDGRKQPTASERPNRLVARKSIVAAREIAALEVFTASNLAARRPGNGVSPMAWNEVVGRVADRDYRPGDLIVMPGLPAPAGK